MIVKKKTEKGFLWSNPSGSNEIHLKGLVPNSNPAPKQNDYKSENNWLLKIRHLRVTFDYKTNVSRVLGYSPDWIFMPLFSVIWSNADCQQMCKFAIMYLNPFANPDH